VALRTQVAQFLGRQSGSRRLPPVLILGETGTGKGLLARAIHDERPRAAGPFVAINCAAIPETLLEAELFGFEQGAFTDARHAKAGLFQTAHRGTLFLDEIGLLPESLQSKLLTVLEDRAVRRLGSTRSETVDVWIIAATSEDMKAAARRRRLREDLFHRLAVVTFQLPPLRERGQDILILAEHFLARTCADYGLAPKTLTDDARTALLAHRWPGNVRELANMMERIALLSDARGVTADSLELGASQGRRVTRPQGDGVSAAQTRESTSLEQAVGEVERSRIAAALHETGGNISHAANRLGITRNTLRYRLTKYGLQVSRGTAEPPLPIEPMSTVEPTPAPRTVHMQWERRHVALLRADLVPTSVGRVPDPGPALETLIEKVDTFGGHVEEVSPRGLVAAFGLEPIEDAPRRAAYAALAIHKSIAHGQGGTAESPGVRIGLHVGPALVARVDSTARLDHEFKREAWTRLETFIGSAEPGTVLMSDATRPFLERRFVVVPLATNDGNAGKVYRLDGLERTGLGLGNQLTPLVARSRELTQLAESLGRAESAHGQLIAVVGEAGVGKTRLLWEFVQSHRSDDALILFSSAASYGTATPYLPIIDLLKSYFRIEPGDDACQLEERVTAKILTLGQALAPARPAVLALLDTPPHDAQWDMLDSLQKQRRTLEAVKLLLLEESRVKPVIVIVEDLHWIDSKTQAALDTLIESLPSHRVLVLVSYRPEYTHGWANKSCYAQLRLDALSPDDAHSLLDGMVGGDGMAASLKAELIERTGGNPFFLEEGVRTLVETGVLVGERGAYRLTRPTADTQVPATVQAVLAARVERLPPEDRKLLQTAAVLGKDVPLALLRLVADLSEEVLCAGLARLQRSEFLSETSLIPETIYAFKHALTHEVAYAGLLENQRRALHARIMAAIEQLYGHRLAEHVDRLAHHALGGGVSDKAVFYFREAGAKAADRTAYREAVACFEHALGALTHLPDSRETTERGVDLRIDLWNSLQPLGNIPRGFEYLCEAAILGERLGDQRRLGWIAAYLAHCYWQSSDLDRAIESGRRALDTALACGDFALQVVANLHVGQAHLSLGDLRCARGYLQSNVESLGGDRSRERFGQRFFPSVISRLWLVHVLVELGEFAEAIVRGEEAAEIAKAVDHPLSLIQACRGLGYLYLRKGDLERAIQFLERCSELSRVWSIPASMPGIIGYMGYAYVLSGRIAQGLSLLERIKDGSLTQDLTVYAVNLANLGEAYALANREDDALRTLKQALDFSRDRKRRHQEAWVLRALGEIAMHRDPPDAETAEGSYRQALALAEELGLRPIVAHCHVGLGKLYGRARKRQEACEHLTIAATMLREMDMRFWLEKAEAEGNSV
jgi:transcriptional regulator with AAA-type ATPase domain/tetratricopeptide (TPR) repeat protein